MVQSVSRLDNLKTLRVANIDSALAAAFMSLLGGAYLVKFVQYLGGDMNKGRLDMMIALFTAIPSLVGLLQIPGAIWGRRYPYYKGFIGPGGAIWRFLYIPIAILPSLHLPNVVAITLVILCVGVASASVQIVSPIYNDWMAEMVPANSRGWFFSRRNAMQAWVGALAAFGGGFLFDELGKATNPQVTYTVIFTLGIVFGLVSLVYFYRMKDIPRPDVMQVGFVESIRNMQVPFKNREFRKTLVFFSVFLIASSFAGNLWSAYAFETLKMGMTAFQVSAICHAAGNISAIRMWGFLSDKYGNKPVMVLLIAGISLTPFPWMICQPNQDVFNAVVLGITHIIAGMCWGGISVCQFNLLLATSPEEGRANYLGAGMAMQSLMGAVGPLLGAEVMSQLRHQVPAATAFHAIFAITAVLRVCSILVLLRVHESGSVSVKGTFTELAKMSPRGYMALRQMKGSSDATVRGAAIDSAADVQFDIARDEVIRALHDPSPRLRRKAARALSSLRGGEASGALIEMLLEHPDLAEEEMLETLGQLENPDAEPVLIEYLGSPRPLLRRAAARALGNLGGPQAGEALKGAAQSNLDPDLRRAALQGLRELEFMGAESEIAEACLDPHPSVRIAAAEAIEALTIRSATPKLRASLSRFSDEACSEIAYALGAVGDETDLVLILQEARRSTSDITRWRCLLGVAKCLGCETIAYRLMLQEGMARDSLAARLLRESHAPNEVFRSFDLFTRDEEFQALRALAKFDAGLEPLVQNPVEDLYLVALAKVISNLNTRV